MVQDSMISVVVPVRDRAGRIEGLIEAVLGVLEKSFRNFEILIVDDGSRDHTVSSIKRLMEACENLRLITLSRPYGDHVAFAAGLDHAIGDYVIIMRPTFQDPPELIPALVAKADEGNDVVYVRHESRGGGLSGKASRAATALLFAVARSWTDLALDPYATEFQLFSRRAVNAANKLKEHTSFVRVLYAFLGYSVASITIEPPKATADDGRYTFRQKLGLAIETIVSFSHRPLRYAAVLALVISSLALLGSLYAVIAKVTSDEVVEGWTSIMVVMLFMFSILFGLLSVISEYVFRILRESQQRPLYYVREELGGSKVVVDSMLDADILGARNGAHEVRAAAKAGRR
jgi:dolichol-phosphate mannosyltransferase